MRHAARVLHFSMGQSSGAEILGPNWYLSKSTGDIEDVGRHAQARHYLPQCMHQRLADFDGYPEMRSTGREIRMVQIIGTHFECDESAK